MGWFIHGRADAQTSAAGRVDGGQAHFTV
jgi:hypothetical protein